MEEVGWTGSAQLFYSMNDISLEDAESLGCLLSLAMMLRFDRDLFDVESYKERIGGINNINNINYAIEMLNKYNRTDLIAILLDKKKNIDKSGDFEL